MVGGNDVLSRKRSRSTVSENNQQGQDAPPRYVKRVKHTVVPLSTTVKHDLLAQYYTETVTLRQYFLLRLPKTSRLRRRKISSIGRVGPGADRTPTEEERLLGDYLDSTIVARRYSSGETDEKADLRWKQWVAFSQKGSESCTTLSDGLKGSIYTQAEIVDFVIWLLFSRETASWPKHLLCDGFRKQTGPGMQANPAAAAGTTIPGVIRVYPNEHVDALKSSPWPQLLMLLGKEGERIMIDLLVDCAIFQPVKAGRGNLYQLCGVPVHELEALSKAARDVVRDTKLKPNLSSKANASANTSGLGPKNAELRPSEICFVRSRMLYARAALNARGLVHFGLRHIHVLNRFPYRDGEDGDESAVHVMMYIFPRQFGLHNVFTSPVDRSQTTQRFQDYTLREEEIAKKFPPVVVPKSDGSSAAKKSTRHVHIPKRLRGDALRLVRRLQVLHKRCAYTELLQYYCPLPIRGNGQKEEAVQVVQSRSVSSSLRSSLKPAKGREKSKTSGPAIVENLEYSTLTDLATPISSVSAFCQAVISKVIPKDFWGTGPVQEHNQACFLKKVHHFIHLRRFESMCLHEVMQGMKVHEIEWLAPPGLRGQKSSQSDTRKRTEIFYEFLYYLFDSFLIPLIRSNFYVTESSTDKYRLFFFRHDVWRYVAEPAMAALKTKMFEEVKTEDALRILEARQLGFSQVRLLPKQTSMRPIMNLRRRTAIRGKQRVLGPSINSILGPVNSVLKLEKALNPSRLGASMFSVGDIYQRIKAFKSRLGPGPHNNLFFAKIDVQAAFDTIPQDAIIALLNQIPQHVQYALLKHVEIAMSDATGPKSVARPYKRWHITALAAAAATERNGGGVRAQPSFPDRVEQSLALKRRDTVFVDSAVRRTLKARDILALAAEHIAQNLVRIGKKYYRQKEGIPQGSVLSSMLCSWFYADLERRRLGFLLESEDCLLMRLIDDFLLITTDRGKAERFVEVMTAGVPEYGVTVNPKKSLVNFDTVVGGEPVPRPEGVRDRFPYCGLWIDCKTLGIVKQRDGLQEPAIFNSLTVDFSRSPGWNFKRKVINAFKIQSHLMFFDTSLNPRTTVLSNIYSAFMETATKMWAYARCMAAAGKKPARGIITETIKTLIDVAFVLLTSRARRERYPGYVCSVKKGEVSWLAMTACRQVLKRKQAGYGDTLAWLDGEMQKLSLRKGLDVAALGKVVKESRAG